MLFHIPFISIFVLALTAAARPTFDPTKGGKATPTSSKEVYAQRQTSWEEIAYRSHLKGTVKLVSRTVPALRRRDPSDIPIAPQGRRAVDDSPTHVLRIAPREESQGAGVPLPLERRAPEPRVMPVTPESAQKVPVHPQTYPKCGGDRPTGYAHYPGWKLVGDELSGAVPVSPESACVQACNKYGGACSGISYDSTTKKCFLKGTHPLGWDFVQTESESDGTDLIGGCAMWSGIVPPEMDAVCCGD